MVTWPQTTNDMAIISQPMWGFDSGRACISHNLNIHEIIIFLLVSTMRFTWNCGWVLIWGDVINIRYVIPCTMSCLWFLSHHWLCYSLATLINNEDDIRIYVVVCDVLLFDTSNWCNYRCLHVVTYNNTRWHECDMTCMMTRNDTWQVKWRHHMPYHLSIYYNMCLWACFSC